MEPITNTKLHLPNCGNGLIAAAPNKAAIPTDKASRNNSSPLTKLSALEQSGHLFTCDKYLKYKQVSLHLFSMDVYVITQNEI